MATIYEEMIFVVASALGENLVKKVAFVGGCTTGLLLTDPFSKEDVRHTEDVDLIVDVLSYSGWVTLQNQLTERGFSVAVEDDITCRMRLGELVSILKPPIFNFPGGTILPLYKNCFVNQRA